MTFSTDSASLAAGEHSCIVYDHDALENIELLVPSIKEALAQNQRFIYIADTAALDALSERLAAQGVNVQRETDRGALKRWTRKEWRQPGKFDSEKKAKQVRQFVEDALAAGFSGARFAVEMSWILDQDISAQQLAHWEATINQIFVPGFPAGIACLYDRKRLSSDVILAGLHTHPVAIVGQYRHQNCFYEAPLILNGITTAVTDNSRRTGEPVPAANDVGQARVEWLLSQLERSRTVTADRVEFARTQAAAVELERAQRAIDASERRFKILADSCPVLIWIGGSGGCEFANRTMVDFFGRPEQELLGLGWSALIHPDDYKECVNSYQSAVKTQSEFSVQMRARRQDGQWRWMLSRGVPFFNPDGAFVGYIGTSTDIHDQKQADEASQRLAAIVESSDDAIISKDLDGVIMSWNRGAQRIFGYTAEEVIGRPVAILIPPDRLHEEPGILQRIRRGDRIDHYETVRRCKDGTLLNISLTVSPIRNSQGRIIGASKIARDVTDRIRRESMLERMQQDLERLNSELEHRVHIRTSELAETVADLEAFSYSITHDLRAPLRSMQSFATMLEQDCGQDVSPVGKDYIRRIVTSARRMDRLIQDVLTYSRIARSELRLESIDVEHLVRGIVESYPDFQAPHATIEIRSPLAPVLANEAALTQCVSNLISNAIKFVPEGQNPRVSVWTEPAGERIRICVRDYGIGIPAKHQERIFGIFQRLSKSYEGTGIGLSIVKKAVERMGGIVGLISEPGKGSTFWLDLLPASATQPA